MQKWRRDAPGPAADATGSDRKDAFADELATLAANYGPGYRRQTILALMLGIFPIIMSATVINVVIPDIELFFQAGHLATQVLTSSFLASMAATMLLAGGLIGRLGVRRTFRWLNIGFIVASLSVLISPGGFPALVLVRVIQGCIAGVAQTLAMIVIMAVFRPEQRGRAMSIYGLGIVLSPAIGPFLGGTLSSLFGWQSVFVFSLPFSLLSMLLGSARLPLAAPVDLPRQIRTIPIILLATFVVALTAAFLLWLQNPPAGWFFAALAGVGFGLFVLDQSRTRMQMLNFGLLRYSGVLAACLVSFSYGAGLYGSTYLIPVYLRVVGGYGAWEAGLALLPGGVFLAFALYAGGHLADRLPAAQLLLAGLLAFTLSNAAFLLQLTPVSLPWVIAFTILGRIGLGLIIPTLNAGATRQAPDSYAATVSVLVNFSRQLGGTVGAGLVGLLLELGTRDNPADPTAFGHAFAAMALCFVPAMLAARWMRSGPANSSTTFKGSS